MVPHQRGQQGASQDPPSPIAVSLWFVTPAWKRYELSEVCFEQRRRVIDFLATKGIDSQCVVVADDENLDTARALGFDTVEQNNDWLARKFNDGIEHACRNGATWVVPIGSDSFIDPAYFLPLPPDNPNVVRTSQLYAPVEKERLAITRVAHPTNPAGPHMFHRELLAKANYRPMPDQTKNNRHTDSNTVKTLWPFRWEYKDVHELQYIGFRAPPFITLYDSLWKRWGISEHDDPWERLAEHYDPALVARAKAAMCE